MPCYGERITKIGDYLSVVGLLHGSEHTRLLAAFQRLDLGNPAVSLCLCHCSRIFHINSRDFSFDLANWTFEPFVCP